MVTALRTNERATEYFSGSALKALGSGKVGGYLVVYGGPKDAQGEYFRPDCEFHLDWYDGAKRPILYHHGLNDQDLIEEVGYIYKITKDERGVWAEGQLDMGNPRAQQVYAEASRGKIGWSSGSAPHLSKVEADGGISEWAIVEGSLTPTPAAGKRTTVQALKFDFTSSFTPTNDTLAPIEPGTVKEATAKVKEGERINDKQTDPKGKTPMNIATKSAGLIGAMQEAGIDPEAILKVLVAMEESSEGEPATMAADAPDMVPMSDEPAKDAGPTIEGDGGADIRDTGPVPATTPPAQSPAPAPGSKAKAGNPDARTLATALQIALSTMKAAPAQSRAQGFQGENPARTPRITDVRTPFHSLKAEDMAFLFQMRAGAKIPRIMPVEFQREMAEKAMKAYQAGDLDMPAETARKLSVKSAEFNNVAVASDGQNWVPDLWSSVLWQRTRIDNNVARNIEVFQMPSPTFEYPIESTDPVVYSVGESESDAEQTLATNVFTRSKLVASKLQFVAKKTGLQVGFSTEIEEDSIIPFIPQLRAQATRAFANSIDYNILNSDSTTGTGNINYKGANTSAAATSNFLFGGGQGMRYAALVTNTTMLKNFQGGIPTLSGIRALRFLMLSATQAYGINPEDLVIITDPYTYGKFLSIDEINVYMNNGRNATVNTGVVPAIDGTQVFPSYEMKLAESDGYVLSSGASALGNFVIFAKNAWKLGYVRQVMTDVSYIPWNDSYILTMTARYAIGKKDTVASALGYNILVS